METRAGAVAKYTGRYELAAPFGTATATALTTGAPAAFHRFALFRMGVS
jgi:hypothetical protein